MRDRLIPAIVMLIAGAITSILNMVNKVEMVTGLKRLLLVLIIFYFIGLIARAILGKVLHPVEKPNDTVEKEEAGDKDTQES